MHYVAHLLERYNRSRGQDPAVELRGYNTATWVPPEYQFHGVALAINRLAYSPCKSYRDLYFELVQGIPRPPTWPRVVGRAVDAIYQRVHEVARRYCHSSQPSDFDLVEFLAGEGPALVERVLKEELRNIETIQPKPPGAKDQTRLRRSLEKIVRFEARQISFTIEREMARVMQQRPGEIFDQHFDFNVQFNVESRKLGFASPSTADFFYHQAVLGDIKVGEWQSYYDYTMVAYALAYEEEQEADLNLGAILLVQCPPNRRVPSHQGSCLEFLDDARRKRFLIIRDRKLEIIANRIDPGRAEREEDCDRNCPYWERCWGAGSNG